MDMLPKEIISRLYSIFLHLYTFALANSFSAAEAYMSRGYIPHAHHKEIRGVRSTQSNGRELLMVVFVSANKMMPGQQPAASFFKAIRLCRRIWRSNMIRET